MIIQYDNVNLTQGKQTVLHDVSFSVGEGDLVYLLGRVGSGKTTLMKSLYGEVPIAAGADTKARLLEYDLVRLSQKQIPYLRRRIGIVFQDFQLLTDRSVKENLLFVLRATGWKDKKMMLDQVRDVLEQVGMADKMDSMPYHLSGGEQQRVVIARALLNSPSVILADEPTGNLDQETGEEIMRLLWDIRQAGTAVIMATHNMRWVENYPGRKLIFQDGLVLEEAGLKVE